MRQATHRLIWLCALASVLVSSDAVASQKKASAPIANPAVNYAAIDAAADRILPKVVAWRRDFHEHPELGNSEVRTAKIVADELRALGFEVRVGGGDRNAPFSGRTGPNSRALWLSVKRIAG
mgnify:CR=1 FL=1